MTMDAAQYGVASSTRGNATMVRGRPDRAAGNIPGGVKDDLDSLAAGVLHWIRRNLEFLDPASPAELPTTPKVKATLELAQFCRIWGRLRPDDDGLDEVTAFVRKFWESPDFLHQVVAKPKW